MLQDPLETFHSGDIPFYSYGCISGICRRPPYSISKDAAGNELFSEDNLPPSAAPDCEYSGPKQGFRICMDQELFDKMNDISSMHKLYETYPRFHGAVDTIEQAWKERSTF